MDAAEVKDRLKSVINNLIKDQPEEASKDLHDVLAAKMRDRINPEAAAEVDVGDEGEAEVTDNYEDGESGGADE
jgi:hypothetical protein